MQSDVRSLDTTLAQPGENFWREVKASGGSGHRSALSRIDGLVTVAVALRILAGDIGRKRNMSDLFDLREEVACGLKTNSALPKFAPPYDLGPQFGMFSETEMF